MFRLFDYALREITRTQCPRARQYFGGNFAASALTTIRVYSVSILGTAYVGGFDCVCRLLRSTGREHVTSELKQKELEAGGWA
jgi:hypothetical protein